MVVAVVGALAVPLVYGLVRALGLPTAALYAALVAALSPWQIFLSRVVIPPALVATTWTLCLWAAARFVVGVRRRDALFLAIAAGIGLYAYPPMKLAVPLLVALALALALLRHSWRAAARWWLPALILGVLWLPFAAGTLLNPTGNARLQLIMLTADSPGAWLAAWWQNYTVYFQPSFYYAAGTIRKIVQALPDHALALGAEAPLLIALIGLPALAIAGRRYHPSRPHDAPAGGPSVVRVPAHLWALLIGALLIAPLPASLTRGSPNAFRASLIAPVYAVLVGVGVAVVWDLLGWLPARVRASARGLAAVALVTTLAWQSWGWYSDLLGRYPAMADATWFYAEGELEAMQRVVSHAPRFDEVLLDTSTVARPYIFLLAAQAMPPAEAQARIEVERQPPHVNNVTRIGRYAFGDFRALRVPQRLPVVEAIPTRYGGPGYLLQEWKRNGRRVLVVRSMTTQPLSDSATDGASDP